MSHFYNRVAATLATGLIVSANPHVAAAEPVTITNASFEIPSTPPGSFDVNGPPFGWSSYGSLNQFDRAVGVVNPATTDLYVEPAPDGANIALVFLQNYSGNEAGIRQTLTDVLEVRTRYTLRVEVGNMAPVEGPFDFEGFPGYRVELMAGGVIVASDMNTLLPGEGRFLTSTVQLTVGDSHPQAGGLLGIRLVNLDGAPGTEVNFDDVRLDATSIDCASVPPSGCKQAMPARGDLSFVLGDVPEKNAAAWSWKGEATSLEDLGTPDLTTSYQLCVYDGGGEAVAQLDAPAGGTCAGKPCWKVSSRGARYSDKSGTSGGLASLHLKTGADGKASIKLKARGAALSVPELPLLQDPDPVQVILRNDETDACWEARYSTVTGDPLSTTKWSARND